MNYVQYYFSYRYQGSAHNPPETCGSHPNHLGFAARCMCALRSGRCHPCRPPPPQAIPFPSTSMYRRWGGGEEGKNSRNQTRFRVPHCFIYISLGALWASGLHAMTLRAQTGPWSRPASPAMTTLVV